MKQLFTLYLNDLAQTVFLKHFDILYSNLHCRGRFRHFLNRGKIKTLRLFFLEKLYLLYDFVSNGVKVQQVEFSIGSPFPFKIDLIRQKNRIYAFFLPKHKYMFLNCIVLYLMYVNFSGRIDGSSIFAEPPLKLFRLFTVQTLHQRRQFRKNSTVTSLLSLIFNSVHSIVNISQIKKKIRLHF